MRYSAYAGFQHFIFDLKNNGTIIILQVDLKFATFKCIFLNDQCLDYKNV